MKKIKIAFLSMIALMASHASFADPIEEGKSIFMTRCAACHNVNKQLTGPALAGIDERRSIEWIVNFVRSSQTMIKKGDKDAVSLYEKFNKVPMPDHPDLGETHIRQVVDYIKSEARTAETSATSSKPRTKGKNYMEPLSINDIGFFGSYFLAVALLISVLVFAVHIRGMRKA